MNGPQYGKTFGESPRDQRNRLDRAVYGSSFARDPAVPFMLERRTPMVGTGSLLGDITGFVGGVFTGGAVLGMLMGPAGVIAGSILGGAYHDAIGNAATWFVRNVIDSPTIVTIVGVVAMIAKGIPVVGSLMSIAILSAYTGLRIVGDLSARLMNNDSMSLSDVKRVLLGAAANAPILSAIPEFEQKANECRKVEMFLNEGLDHFSSRCPNGVVTLECLNTQLSQMPKSEEYSDQIDDKVRSLDPDGWARAEQVVLKYNGNEAGMIAAWRAGKIACIVPKQYQKHFANDLNAVANAEAAGAVPLGSNAGLVKAMMAVAAGRGHVAAFTPRDAQAIVAMAPNTVEVVPLHLVHPTTRAASPPGSAFVGAKQSLIAPQPAGIGDEIFLIVQKLIGGVEGLIGLKP